MDKWYFSKSLNTLCQFFFKEVSNQIPQILEYVEDEKPSKVEAILTEAHRKGFQFIIESVWDFGYDVFLLKKTVTCMNCGNLILMRLLKLLNGSI